MIHGLETLAAGAGGELGVYCHPVVTSRQISSTVGVPDVHGVAFPATTVDGRASVILMKVTQLDQQPR